MPTETRYADFSTWTVNGLTANKHITTMSSTTGWAFTVFNAAIKTMFMAIRIWKRSSAGVETEIGTAGTYKAQASGTPTITKTAYYGSYTYPTVALVSTDCLVVKVYMRLINNSFADTDLAATLVSEQLGAQSLDTNTFQVLYMINYIAPNYTHLLWFGWYSLYGEYFDYWEIYQWKWTTYVPPSAGLKRLLVGVGL